MAEAPPPPPGLRGTVLVVDDTPDTLAMLTDALERRGCAVLVATSGAAALLICERVTPDAVLMDAVMPGLDGFESCRRLKAMPAAAHVPVVFMTALSETEHVVEGLAAGGVDYVTKPIVLDELFARLRVHLANARAAQSARLALAAAGGFLLAVDGGGRILWSTPRAAQLLDGLPADGTEAALPASALPAILAAIAAGPSAATLGLPVGPGGEERLAMTYLGGGGVGEHLFRLARREADAEVLRGRFALTGREADVLVWIARGKTNRDIGDILGLSPRTVNKHLETIYRKLGVENRASAAVLASRVLDG